MATAASHRRRTVRLSVTDFGPIAAAEVELRPLTVFVGPSNTGKSFLSVLLYVLHRWFSTDEQAFRYRVDSPWSRFARLQRPTLQDVRKLRDPVLAWLRTTVEDDDGPKPVPQEVVDLARANLTRPELGQYFVEELVRCFGVDDLAQLVRNGRSRSAKFGLSTPVDAVSNDRFKFGGTIQSRNFAWQSHIPSDTTIGLDSRRLADHARNLEIQPDGRGTAYALSEILSRVANALAGECVGPFLRSAYYLPADRTGIMHAHRVVVGSLIRGSSHAGFRAEGPLPVLSGVVADFLERLVEMPGRFRRRSANVRLARQLEERLLDGAIDIQTSETGYPSFLYRPQGWSRDIPLMNTSSMVAEVAPVVLFLRHVVQSGNTLIVEEPEAHLHPAKQVELTRHLAAAVHAGVRVIITTHSEWVLESLANLVHLSGLRRTKRQGIDGAELALSPNQVGAWMFKPKNRPKGSVVEEIPLDPQTGTFPAGYDDITESLYNEWATMTNRIESAKQQ